MEPLGPAAAPRFLARTAAGAAAGCATLHGLLLGAVPGPGTAPRALLVGVCLLCAVHLFRRPGRAAWAAHVVLTTAMLAAHPPELAGHSGHAGTGLTTWVAPVAGALAAAGLLLAAVRGLGGLALKRG
ncbi:hypothetical protein DQ237_16465 [Blastococcus sp. TF02-8]|uniref:hypothetical protein n=1 Tax=Blastococcus sp. TF02-8 TaxID=2250574 RepID=UPI000DE86006|nr:hypothetical protein [Blastococcus sp. TF02-8]RBY93767.1 hypothetical protein DQ237_16465 [Blastococcus sp. TF02-8]